MTCEFVTLFSSDEFDNKSVLLTLGIGQSVGDRNVLLLHRGAGPVLALDLMENPKATLGFQKFEMSPRRPIVYVRFANSRCENAVSCGRDYRGASRHQRLGTEPARKLGGGKG